MLPERVGIGPEEGTLPHALPAARPLVLVVEDEPDCRTIYRTILLASGFAVVDTGDGSEALRYAAALAPDLVLMDLGVPGTDGWAATRALRAREDTASIPVVVLTAHAFPEHEARAREAGCSAFLTKPIAPSEVVEVIRELLHLPC